MRGVTTGEANLPTALCGVFALDPCTSLYYTALVCDKILTTSQPRCTHEAAPSHRNGATPVKWRTATVQAATRQGPGAELQNLRAMIQSRNPLYKPYLQFFSP